MTATTTRSTTQSLTRTIATPAWAGLILISLVIWLVGAERGHGLIALGVIVLAFAKVAVIGRYFMELRDAPPLLQWMFNAWCVVACAGVVVTNYLG